MSQFILIVNSIYLLRVWELVVCGWVNRPSIINEKRCRRGHPWLLVASLCLPVSASMPISCWKASSISTIADGGNSTSLPKTPLIAKLAPIAKLVVGKDKSDTGKEDESNELS